MPKVLLIFFLWILSVSAIAQSDTLRLKNDKSPITQKQFNKEQLKTYSLDKDFDYSQEIVNNDPTIIERFIKWMGRLLLNFLEWIFGVRYAAGIFAKTLTALPYIIAILVLVLMIKFFLKVNSNSMLSRASNEEIVMITEEEELIKNKDLSHLTKQAIENNNYTLAIRYYYLELLKQLENKKIIIWEKQKTNKDYYHEISEGNLKLSFEELTRLYDFIWYGKFTINEIEFAQVQLNFEQMNNRLNNHKIG